MWMVVQKKAMVVGCSMGGFRGAPWLIGGLEILVQFPVWLTSHNGVRLMQPVSQYFYSGRTTVFVHGICGTLMILNYV